MPRTIEHASKTPRSMQKKPRVKVPEITSLNELRRQYLREEVEQEKMEQMTPNEVGEQFAKQVLARVKELLSR